MRVTLITTWAPADPQLHTGERQPQNHRTKLRQALTADSQVFVSGCASAASHSQASRPAECPHRKLGAPQLAALATPFAADLHAERVRYGAFARKNGEKRRKKARIQLSERKSTHSHLWLGGEARERVLERVLVHPKPANSCGGIFWCVGRLRQR